MSESYPITPKRTVSVLAYLLRKQREKQEEKRLATLEVLCKASTPRTTPDEYVHDFSFAVEPDHHILID